MVPGEEEDPANAINGSRRLAYLPSLSTTYSIWYKRHWMKITRIQTQTGYYGKTEDTLQIRFVSAGRSGVGFLFI
jgi:mitochondrial chaperone BCS1